MTYEPFTGLPFGYSRGGDLALAAWSDAELFAASQEALLKPDEFVHMGRPHRLPSFWPDLALELGRRLQKQADRR